MLPNLLRKSSIYATLTLLLFSCRQPQDLDTDRTVVPTNLPEITDFSPKVTWRGDRITIIGKNFVNVKKVMLDTVALDSIIVENRNRMSARIPNHILQGTVNTSRTYKISVTTSIGVAEAQQKIALSVTSITGFISLSEHPLDSVVVVITYIAKNLTTQTLTGYSINMKSSGFYDFWQNNINTGSSTNIPNGTDFTIRPFLSGYAFTPAEQTVIIQNGRTVGETEFKASKVPAETMPEVTSISPNTASSFSGSTETGTTIVLNGKGFTGVRKVMIGIPYPASPGSSALSVGYTEATTVTINSDNQITVTLPRLDRTKTVSGRTYANCQIYLVREDVSLLAPQRISITYI